jgi:hypothetical protein
MQNDHASYVDHSPDDHLEHGALDAGQFDDCGLDDVPGADHDPPPGGGPDPDPWHQGGDVPDPWHEQESSNTCAVAAQEFVLDDLTGVDHPESELRDVATEHGWYSPDGGTPMADTGKLLEYYGIPTEQHQNATMSDLEQSLAQGDGVIVGVDAGEIWNPGQDPDDVVGEHLGVPGEGADHAVQVIGVDRSDPANPMVVLRDSGTPNGDGERVPLATFEGAWEDSGHFMVTAHPPGSASSGPSLGTSYTVDGTTDSGHPVEWSTSTNAYHDQSTWEEVTPR